ncbi:hypothetical protein [Butyrivibrio sp. VCB2006]|uniref:hypothetical protein n=1 Tax=Butyrivibrio sp. VCB2006 TaxID=1280679 RepID=UPI00040A617E|nr:hypothetical protein [Butyrivibrio sp. VCB2006]
MKLFMKKEKGTNSVKDLLKKLKRHDTKVVAIAVIIALVLSGGLIYISTPIVAENATEGLAESERLANQDTVDKLGEIGEYLSELDKVVTSNQESLNSINERSDSENSEATSAISEKVIGIDSKLKEVHTNIDGTTTKIENLKTIIEKGDSDNKEQIEKEFTVINADLDSIKSDYDSAQSQIKELMDKLQKEIDSGNKQLDEKAADNHKALLNELSSMNKSMDEKSSKSIATFQEDISALGMSVTKKLDDYQNTMNNNIEEVNNNVNNNFNNINKSVGDGFGDLKSYIDSSAKNINDKLDLVFQRVSDGKKKLVSTLLTYGISVKEDAKFDDINNGIIELGDKMRDAERKIEDSEHSVTPEKILAGQTVTVNDQTITGTATSDASCLSDHILSGQTAYVNGAMVIGTMANHGSVNIALSKDNRSQSLEAGYYDSITVTADISSLPANITYTHHVHSNSATDKTVVDTSFSSGKAYGGDTSSSKGGCFNEPIYGPCGGSGEALYEDYGGYYYDYDGDGQLDQNVFHYGFCTTCGGRVDAGGYGQIGRCDNQRVIGYKASCGKVSGQVIAAEVTY